MSEFVNRSTMLLSSEEGSKGEQSAAAMWEIVKKQVIRIKLAAARDDSTDERHKGWVCRPADRQVRYACCNRCDFPAAAVP